MGVGSCMVCNKVLEKRWQNKYCSNKCQADKRYEIYIKDWKRGFKNGSMGILARGVSRHVRRYLIEKYGEKCSKCGWSKRNLVTGRVVLEIDHVDGNSENNLESNLRLLCPNCHALTPSFKNLNKGKGRRWRMDKYIKNR